MFFFLFSFKDSSSLSSSESRAKTPLPDSFECFFDPQRSFGITFRALFLKKRDFFCSGETFLPNTQGPLGCLLRFWPSGPKPCGGNNFGEFQHEYNLNLNIVSFLHINEKYHSLLSVSIPSHHSSVSLLNNQRENLVLLET